jgi:hypothetical protein
MLRISNLNFMPRNFHAQLAEEKERDEREEDLFLTARSWGA